MATVRAGSRPGARPRRAGRARRRGPGGLRERARRRGSAHDRARPVPRHGPAVHPDPGRARPDPRARPLRDRPLGEGPGARVRHRLPAAGQGPRPRQARSRGPRAAGASSPPCRRGSSPARPRPPRSSRRRRSSTRAARGRVYTLNWLPIGGFVKLEGEDGDNANDPRAFSRARLPVKLGILVAGVAMNLLLAFVIFTGLALWGEPQIGVRIGEVVAGAPAAASGLVAGDTIVTINGTRYSAVRQPGAGDRRPPGERRPARHARDHPCRRQLERRRRRPAGANPGAAGSARDPGVGRVDRRQDRQHVRRGGPDRRQAHGPGVQPHPGRPRRPRPLDRHRSRRRRRRRPVPSGSRSSWATSCGASGRCT